MSFPRLALLALGLPLLSGGCAAVVSYGADAVSYVDSGKSTSDHLVSMVSKKDCAFWRVFRDQDICRPRPDGKDPYHVDYDTAERMPSEDGTSYAPPLRQTPDEPASSWTAQAYAKKPEPAAPESAPASVPASPAAEPAVAATEPPPPAEEKPAPVHKPAKKKAKARPHPHAVAHAKPVKKASPNQVASVP